MRRTKSPPPNSLPTKRRLNLVAYVLFLTTDMMFSSRVLGAAGALGIECKLIGRPQQLAGVSAGDCRLVLIDLTLQPLDLPATVASIRAVAPSAKIVAFGPHVDEQLLAGAKAAGCDLVLPRSQFHKQYVELLRASASPA